MPSPLEEFFDSLETSADFARLVADRVHEDIHLEFKTKRNRSVPDLEDSERWQFSRALSGFANSDGGVLVFGIETDKEEKAKVLKPITNPVEFQARLKKSLLNATQPVVPNVRIEVVLGAAATEGFIKVLVPASDRVPHRAMLADREYYKRSTEGFYRMEHFDLADMFGRRRRPVLTVQLEKQGLGETILVSISNEGRGVAKAPYLALDLPAPFKASPYGFDGNGSFGLPPFGRGYERSFFGGDANRVIHAGQKLVITKLDARTTQPDGRPVVKGLQRFRFEVAAEDVELITGEIVLEY
jgi:hypothetical protein